MRLRALVALAVLHPLAACRSEAPPRAEPQETVVPVAAVAAQRAAIRAVIHASGVIVPAQGGEFLVLAPEPARLADVMKAQGDAVKSGDVLARFDVPSAAQAVARLNADVASAQAQLENARINEERVRGFVERGLVPRRDLEVAERELADAQSAADRARTAFAAAQTGAARAVVRAPFDGIVATRTHNPGDMIVSSTDPILRVVDPRRLEIVASISRADQSRVITGATARIAAAGAEPVRLTVAGPATNRESPDDAVPFRLVFAAPSPLAVDTPVQLDIDAEARTDTVLIPAEALIQNGSETTVFVADNLKAQKRVVTTGIEDGARVEITSGLKAGELVITRGHIGLADGAAITVAAD
jgi:cobalt-zinc-cadmium efflux system membrane fusion protein